MNGLTNAELAHRLIERELIAIVACQAPVLADRDPEPLHQMRVSMRRLRVTLKQFEPLLIFPAELRQNRLAKTARRLGLARDLDVLQQRLDQHLLPQLQDDELQRLRPVLKQLRHERRQAHGQVVDQLKGGAYLAWLAQMQRWLRQPQWTPLAEQPLSDWLLHWHLAWIAELFGHPAWSLQRLQSPAEHEQLHDLRKRIKRARYALENCRPWTSRRLQSLQHQLKGLQEILGELNDLRVLQLAIDDQLPAGLSRALPHLHDQLAQQQRTLWNQWLLQSRRVGHPDTAVMVLQTLSKERRKALFQRRCAQMCSWLHRPVAQDWRRVLPAR